MPHNWGTIPWSAAFYWCGTARMWATMPPSLCSKMWQWYTNSPTSENGMLTCTDRTWHAPERQLATVPIAGIGAMRHGSIVHKKSCRTDRRSPVTEAKLRLVNMEVVILSTTFTSSKLSSTQSNPTYGDYDMRFDEGTRSLCHPVDGNRKSCNKVATCHLGVI